MRREEDTQYSEVQVRTEEFTQIDLNLYAQDNSIFLKKVTKARLFDQGHWSQKLRDPTVLRKYKRDYCQGYIDAESSDDERIFFFLINLLDINNLEHTYQTC